MSPRSILTNPSTRSHQICLVAIFSSCHPEPAPFAGEGSAFSFLRGTAIPRCVLGSFHVCVVVDPCCRDDRRPPQKAAATTALFDQACSFQDFGNGGKRIFLAFGDFDG